MMIRHTCKTTSLKIFILTLFACILSANDQDVTTKAGPITEAAEKLRKTIFEKTIGNPGCTVVGRGFKSQLPELSANLDKLVKNLTTILIKRNDKQLKKLFHPRLKLDRFKIAKLYTDLIGVHGTTDFGISPYRIFAVNTVDGSPIDIPCANEGVAISAHYGFELQLGLWFQVRGADELSRLFITVVPDPDGWYLASWHQQQWTHKGLDYQRWLEKAVLESNAERRLGSYVMYDIAAKLLDGGKHLKIDLAEKIRSARDAMLPNNQDWLGVIKTVLPGEDIGYAGTGFVKDGAGILLRFQLTKKLPFEEVNAHCTKAGKKLYLEKWTTNLGGLQCSYIPKGASVYVDSVLGGVFKTRKELAK